MTCGTPRAGDIVVRLEVRDPHDRYAVLEFPGLAQVSYGSFEKALEIATRFARHSGSDVWHEEDGHFTLIESRSHEVSLS